MITTNIFTRYQIEDKEEWRKWIGEIPFLSFPSTYEVKVIPPFGGAIARFTLRHKEIKDSQLSIYLDCYQALGCWDGPYWELYPYENDVFRCNMLETETLLEAIAFSFEEQRKENQNDSN